LEERDSSHRGVIIACAILGIWAISLLTLLSIDALKLPIAVRLAAIVWQTFLYTGLFITAHDAMHGAVAPRNPKLNNFLGSLSLILYALFSFKSLVRTHWQHHQNPASELDPDYHNGRTTNPISWYFQFMNRYWSWIRFFYLVCTYHVIRLAFGVHSENLTWFWLIPAIASSGQLFFFGTYLPHREPEGGYKNESRAQNSGWSTFWSFISCYHFGYHEEHHDKPHLPWWKLPEAYAEKLKAS
jgi:beta-carotene ketolase (CrtW type)